ncbi:type VI immunity family protein [Chitinophaga sp. HK235]|uniref:type VI immunity family protein n=1 Tax=Chitinophaga sp. HK235 TaxID=2952571 RepID=UPI001BA759B2|nr:type VI immunity family protein [Chitinophaga sp. HK235]
MEQRNWDVFRCRDYKETNHTPPVRYWQEYLQPCLYLTVYFQYTDDELMLDFYNRALELLEPVFNYHNGGTTTAETRIRNKDKALQQFPDFLAAKQNFLWRRLANRGGVGIKDEGGGIGDASFECLIHRRPATPRNLAAAAELAVKYRAELEATGSKQLYKGVSISEMNICLPVDSFTGASAFLDWVSGFRIIQSGSFFSASAGYTMVKWEGYSNSQAQAKLKQLLAEHPGFDYRIPGITVMLGRHFSLEKNCFVPQLKRINWLNMISDEALVFLGGEEGFLKQAAGYPSVSLRPLTKGYIVQAGDAPGIGDSGKAPDAYYDAAQLLQPLLLLPREEDYLDAAGWELHFHKR